MAWPDDITEQMSTFDPSVPTEEFFPGQHVFEFSNGRPLVFSPPATFSGPDGALTTPSEDQTQEKDYFLPSERAFNWPPNRSWLHKQLDRTKGRLALSGVLLTMDDRHTFQEIISGTTDRSSSARPAKQEYDVSDIEPARRTQAAYAALHAMRVFDHGDYGDSIRPISYSETVRALQKHPLSTPKGLRELMTTASIIARDGLGLAVINPLYVSFQATKRCLEAKRALRKVIDNDMSLSPDLRMHRLVSRRFINPTYKPAHSAQSVYDRIENSAKIIGFRRPSQKISAALSMEEGRS